ncbi:uncharacterized protein AB675_6374 [Cyphellophora attinorum]|uniref:DUF899-domain-containing protein n=1 Tax=Cyphellophora attinorum TaxID=1664694 RepID=A0A0N1HFE5_9EURO|nr:uncharacterized protein AB675_6374 [Phialophora attinorum]KPI44010.1 hypothetical protein AB675_6374 [Phialophora attinorum]
MATTTTVQQVVDRNTYLPARLSLLAKEKEATRLRDAISAERKMLGVVAIEKDYKFIDPARPDQPLSLRDLFTDRKQLIIYHAMFAPSDDPSSQACPSCTLFLDHVPHLEHLRSHNTNFVVVSRAKPEQIARYKAQMGYGDRSRWVSSYGSDFNYDFGVTLDGVKNDTYNFQPASHWRERGMEFFTSGEQPGHSVFVLGGENRGVGIGEEGKVYHSYSTYGRGGEEVMGTLRWLDMTPLGRQDGSVDGADGVGYLRRGEYTERDIGKNE